MTKLLSIGGLAVLGVYDRLTFGSVLIALILGCLGLANIINGGKRWKDVAEAAKERAEQMYERCHEYAIAKNDAERISHELEVENAALKERPDFAQMRELQAANHRELAEALATAVRVLQDINRKLDGGRP